MILIRTGYEPNPLDIGETIYRVVKMLSHRFIVHGQLAEVFSPTHARITTYVPWMLLPGMQPTEIQSLHIMNLARVTVRYLLNEGHLDKTSDNEIQIELRAQYQPV